MPPELTDLFARQGGVATAAQIDDRVGRATMQRLVRREQLTKLWPGIYADIPADEPTLLRGLDLRCGAPVAVCMGTAAKLFGFDTEGTTALHVMNPTGCQLRNQQGLVVHRREGAPLCTSAGRLSTAPAWTAVEVARALTRPRALATLDAALRSGRCTVVQLYEAAYQHAGRRGVVAIRDLIPLARTGAESPMESEARLVIIDGGLPEPVLQYQIIDRDGSLWRVDFAWPDHRVAVEYDGFDWHSSPEHLRRDRQKRAALQELGWRVLSIVSDDVRRRPGTMVRRIDALLTASVH